MKQNHTNRIAGIDKNLAIQDTVDCSGAVFYNVRKTPFSIYGLYRPQDEGAFCRLPEEVAQRTSTGVTELYQNTAGGRVRFSTDSSYLILHAEMPLVSRFSHASLCGTAGFDLFLDDPATEESHFRHAFLPPMSMTDGYISKLTLPDRSMRSFTLHFPSYSNVKRLLIGLEPSATLEAGMPYKDRLPIVYYGSSITQGACASRPGNSYQNIIARRMNLDYINLGFSGSGKAEDALCSYMAGLQMSAFVSDYDHNAPDTAYLQSTHEKLYRTIRRTHPDIPYLMLSRPDFARSPKTAAERRDIIRTTYEHALADGDRNVRFLDGEAFFAGKWIDLCTTDGTHPTDLGFALMADQIGQALDEMLYAQ